MARILRLPGIPPMEAYRPAGADARSVTRPTDCGRSSWLRSTVPEKATDGRIEPLQGELRRLAESAISAGLDRPE